MADGSIGSHIGHGDRLHGPAAPATRPGAPGPAPRGPLPPNHFKAKQMAEEQGNTVEMQPNGNDTAPQVGVISQYVKDLSFENPNSPAVYQWQTQPKIEVDFNIGSSKLNDEIYEVALRIEVRATADGQTAFAVDLLYAGLIGIRNIADEGEIQAFLLAEAPRILFPFARHIIAQTVQEGGFPPLMLDPIDFHALYVSRAQQELTEGGAAGEIGQA